MPRLEGRVSSRYSIEDLKKIRKDCWIYNEDRWRMIFPSQSGYINIVDDAKNSQVKVDLRTAGAYVARLLHWFDVLGHN